LEESLNDGTRDHQKDEVYHDSIGKGFG